MKPEWIRGRFRGVYSSERARKDEGPTRLPLELEHGELDDIEPIAAPPSAQVPDELRFARVPRVRIAASAHGPAAGERTLFEVRICDWKLLYPAASEKRVYGTLVGELCARLAPPPIEPTPLAPARPIETHPAPAEASEPAAEPTPEGVAPAPPALEAPAAVSLRPVALPSAHLDDSSREQDLERLLWLVVPVLLCVVGGVLALGCGPHTAALWLAPVVAAIAIRQTPDRYRIHSRLARRWCGGICLLAPVFYLLLKLQTEWVAGCRPPIRADLALLAAPLIGAALIRPQLLLWCCAFLWTTTLLTWCSSLDGTCPAAALAAPMTDAPAAASAPVAPIEPPRTDPDGRWPVHPGL